jgi:hypothetical protein
MSQASQPTAASIFERAKGLLVAPRLEWPKIAGEPANLLPTYVTALAGFAVACGFLRDLMGYQAFGVSYRVSLFDAVTSAVWTFVWQLAAVYLSGRALAWLAPRFGGEADRTNAYRLAGYSATASWLATFFLLVPGLGFLTLLGLYSTYLLATGAPDMLKVPRERVLPFTASFVGICIVAYMVFFTFIRPFLLTHRIPDGPLPAAQSQAEPASQQSQSAGSVSIPGVGKIDVSKLDELGKRLESASNSDGALPPIPASALSQLMPSSLPGFERTSLSTSDTAAGTLNLANVSADYTAGDSVITVSLSDMGPAGAMVSLPGALGFNKTEQSGNSYSKVATVGGRMTTEDFNTDGKIGSYSVLVAERILVKAEGRGADMEQLTAAVGAVDAGAIEAMAKK